MCKPAVNLMIAVILSHTAHAEIEIKKSFEPAEPVEATMSVPGVDLTKLSPDEYDIQWRTDVNSTARTLPNMAHTVHVWPTPGEHTIQGSVAYILDGKPKQYVDSKTYVQKGLVAPTPSDPNAPAPVKRRLYDLVTPQQAVDLSTIYRSLTGIDFSNRDEFDFVHEQRLSARGLSDTPASEEISSRLAAALATFDIEKLRAALGTIVADLSPGDRPAEPAPPSTDKITSIVYVYEQRDGMPAQWVLTTMDRLNREKTGLRATIVDDDTRNAEGEVPKQYIAAFAEAEKIGKPAAIALSGDRVIRSVSKPHEVAQIWSLAP